MSRHIPVNAPRRAQSAAGCPCRPGATAVGVGMCCGVGGQGCCLECCQRGAAGDNCLVGGVPTRGAEVVACLDLGHPTFEPFQVGLGLFHLGVGDPVPGRLRIKFGQQRRRPFDDLGILDVTFGVELGHQLGVLAGVGGDDGQTSGSAALLADPGH
ncbi:MAG TPA: hypothetical protein VL179_08725 [Mycobacterium sp.]|nr:hypothetical protein [Mycobacterium sp.]